VFSKLKAKAPEPALWVDERDHRCLIGGGIEPKMRREIEGVLFGLFRGRSDDSATFESLSDDRRQISASRLHFFLKDMDLVY
jgi:hypothetical protein